MWRCAIAVGLIVTAGACSSDGDPSDGSRPTTLTSATGTSATSSTTRATTPLTPTTPASPSAVAVDLHAEAGCEGPGPNNHIADFSWTPAAERGTAQRLVLSYLPSGLETDAFVQTESLPPDRDAYRWRRLNPDTGPRYWRVQTEHGDQWSVSETSTFEGVGCD